MARTLTENYLQLILNSNLTAQKISKRTGLKAYYIRQISRDCKRENLKNVNEYYEWSAQYQKVQLWKAKVKKGVNTYRLIMQRYLYQDTKEFRLECYDRLIKDMGERKEPKNYEEVIMGTFEQETVLSGYNNKNKRMQKAA
jgi:hypothetical protein